MKVIIGLLVVLGLVIAGVYYLGGYSSFDPNQQGEQAKAAIKPGMTWTQVIAVAGENPKLQTISVSKRKISGQVREERMLGAKVNFSKSQLADRLKYNEYPNGFILSYVFSERVAFDVLFDGTGKVVSVSDAMTMADLLQTR